jgi:hypothetical protein
MSLTWSKLLFGFLSPPFCCAEGQRDVGLRVNAVLWVQRVALSFSFRVNASSLGTESCVVFLLPLFGLQSPNPLDFRLTLGFGSVRSIALRSMLLDFNATVACSSILVVQARIRVISLYEQVRYTRYLLPIYSSFQSIDNFSL